MRNGLSWGKKQKNCDLQNPEDKTKGDQWDHTGIDVPSRFVVSMVIGKRSKDNVKKVVADFADRTGNVPPELITTDDCSSYADAFLEQYGETIIPEKTGARGRPRKPFKRMFKGTVYATVNKDYSKGTVTAVDRKLVHGTEEDLTRALESSSCSDKINTAFVERQNGTDRSYNARKARKTYQYSRDLLVHIAVSWWVMLCYNFHHLHAGLRQSHADGTYLHRTPAMAIGLATKPLTVRELLATQVVGFSHLDSCSLNCAAQGVHDPDP
jgi:hypothetical protein